MIHRHLGPVVRVAVLALLLGAPAAASAQIAVTQSVTGPTITLSWATVSGATTYTVQAGLSSGNYVYSLPATSTGFSINAPITGTFFMKVNATGSGVSQSSNEFTVTVSSLTVTPSTPTGVEAYSYCGGALLRWQPAAGNVVGYVINVSGAVNGAIPTTGTQLFAASAPLGSYAYTVTALGAGGTQSAPSAPVAFSVTSGPGTVPPPVLDAVAYNSYLRLGWSTVPGAVSYGLQASLNGQVFVNQPLPPSQTAVGQIVPLGTWGLTITANASCGASSAPVTSTVNVDNSAPPGPRRADPAPGQRLSLPDRYGVVLQLARERPDLLAQSCREQGGNNRFMFELVRRLRQEDTRWGLNWKRGNRGDMSQDVVTYHYGSGPDEDSTDVYIIDTISGHCGNAPTAFWQDNTVVTIQNGTIGRFTLIPYLNAGNK